MVSRHVWGDCNPEYKSLVKCLTRHEPGRSGRKAAVCCDRQNSPSDSLFHLSFTIMVLFQGLSTIACIGECLAQAY